MKLQVVIDALNWICGLGPMCMMPIIMFVIGICLRVQISKLIKCCITTGVGFCGVNLVINAFIAQVGPSVQNMVKAFGLHTDIMDVGWPARAAATWAYPMVAVVVFVVLGLNILMLVLKLTNCVMVDFGVITISFSVQQFVIMHQEVRYWIDLRGCLCNRYI